MSSWGMGNVRPVRFGKRPCQPPTSKANNLVAILDYNKYQETGPISREMGLEPLVEKWQSFGWHVVEADGHDMEDCSQN